MNQPEDRLLSIGEVCEHLGVRHHVLRHWEAKIPQIRPVRRGKHRYYRPSDLALLQQIRAMVRDNGMSLEGARRELEAGPKAPMSLVRSRLEDIYSRALQLERECSEMVQGLETQGREGAGEPPAGTWGRDSGAQT